MPLADGIHQRRSSESIVWVEFQGACCSQSLHHSHLIFRGSKVQRRALVVVAAVDGCSLLDERFDFRNIAACSGVAQLCDQAVLVEETCAASAAVMRTFEYAGEQARGTR